MTGWASFFFYFFCYAVLGIKNLLKEIRSLMVDCLDWERSIYSNVFQVTGNLFIDGKRPVNNMLLSMRKSKPVPNCPKNQSVLFGFDP